MISEVFSTFGNTNSQVFLVPQQAIYDVGNSLGGPDRDSAAGFIVDSNNLGWGTVANNTNKMLKHHLTYDNLWHHKG